MKSKHTKEKVVFKNDDKWPFALKVETESGKSIIEITPVAYSTAQKTFNDVKNAVGFPFTEREDVILAVANQVDNFKLIADAFNVTNETGMTPRELQKSHAELLDALKMAKYEIETAGGATPRTHLMPTIERAINNATK